MTSPRIVAASLLLIAGAAAAQDTRFRVSLGTSDPATIVVGRALHGSVAVMLRRSSVVRLRVEAHAAVADVAHHIRVLHQLVQGVGVLLAETAQAEALGLDCNVGLMQRLERVVLIGGAVARPD